LLLLLLLVLLLRVLLPRESSSSNQRHGCWKCWYQQSADRFVRASVQTESIVHTASELETPETVRPPPSPVPSDPPADRPPADAAASPTYPRRVADRPPVPQDAPLRMYVAPPPRLYVPHV